MNSRCRCNIREVARQAKVSVATVSRALNNRSPLTEKTRARVLRTVQKLNYQPDPIFRLAFQRRKSTGGDFPRATQTLGFLTNGWMLERAQHDDKYYNHVLAGIQKCAQRQHYQLMLATADAEALAVPEPALNRQIDGLLVEGVFTDLLRSLLTQQMPVVFIDRHYPKLPASSVMPNIEQAVREQLDYLWKLGHRNIVTFQHAAPTLHVEIYMRAFRGFFAEKEHPVLHPDACRRRDIDTQTHERIMAGYAREMVALRPRPTALMSWDTYACSLMVEFQRLGLRVPDDISLVGMDDTVAARLSVPQLTSYRFPMDELGRTATNLLIERIQDRGQPIRHVVINGQIIERASCASMTSDQ